VKYYIELKNMKKMENERIVTEYLAQIETRLKSNCDIKSRIQSLFLMHSMQHYAKKLSFVKALNKRTRTVVDELFIEY
jgi:hypothetical protein